MYEKINVCHFQLSFVTTNHVCTAERNRKLDTGHRHHKNTANFHLKCQCQILGICWLENTTKNKVVSPAALILSNDKAVTMSSEMS